MTAGEGGRRSDILRVFLLGEFRVEVEGQIVGDSAWRLRKARSLVKILALAPGHRLHREQIMEYLWPGSDFGSALNSLNQVLYVARQALAAASSSLRPHDLIRHHNQVLSLLPSGTLWTDAGRFEELARETIRTGDDQHVDEVLALYRSELLPEDLYEEWAIGPRRDLAQLYLDMLHAATSSFELGGDYPRAMQMLHEILNVNRSSEDAHVALMRLYARSGRRQQALQQFHELQNILQAESGATPSQATMTLYRSIIEDSARESAAPHDSGSSSAAIYGRDPEMAALSEAVQSGLGGRGRVLLLSGDAGIGKTTLAESVATPLRERGEALVYWGRCHQDEGAPAYWPWVQIFREYLEVHDSATVEADLGRQARTIKQIVPEVEDVVPGTGQGPGEGDSRFQLFDAVGSVLKRISERRPVLLVLDDLHWADRSSLLLLDFISRELRSSRVVVLGSYRESDLDRYHPLHQTMGQLVRQPGNRRIALSGLSVEDAAMLMAARAGVRPPGRLVVAIHELTEGNPFFVGEVAHLLAQRGDLEGLNAAEVADLSIPQGVREVMYQRLERLSAEAVKVLETCSVIGREFGVHVLRAVLDASPDDLVNVLDEATQARILDENPGEPGFYRFSHALIRETIYDDLGTARRTEIHAAIAAALNRLYAGNVDAILPELAHHHYRATPRGDVARTVEYLGRAGERAMDQVGFDEAAGYFSRALQVLDLGTPVDYPRRCGLLLSLGEAQRGAGDSARSRETCLQAAMLARRLELPEHLARAATTVAWASMEIRPYDAHVVRLLEEALDSLGPADNLYRVQLLGALVRALDYSGDVERRADLGEEAVAVARRLNDPETLVHALEGRLKSAIRPDDLNRAVEDAEEIIRLAGVVDNSYMAILGHWWRIDGMLGKGDIAAVDQSIEIGSRLARERGEPRRIWEALCYQTMRALLGGRFEEAEALASEAAEIGRRPAPRPSWSTYIEHLFMVRREQGRLEEVEADLRERVTNYGDYPYYHALLAVLLAETNRLDEARMEFDWLASSDFRIVPRDVMWLATLALLAEVAHRLEDAEQARILYDLLQPYGGRAVVPDGIEYCLGSSSYFIGLLAETIGLGEETRSAFQAAVEMNTRMDAHALLAHSLFAYARWSFRSAGPEQALDLVSRALDIAHGHQMSRLARRCIALQAEIQQSQAI